MLTYINGKFQPADKAKISVRDRGFRLGDGVFETIAVHGGIPYQIELHMERLEKALAAFDIHADTKNIPTIIKKIITTNGIKNGFVRITISRGESGFGYSAKNSGEPTVVIETEAVRPKKSEPIKLWLSSYTKPSAHMQPVAVKIIGNSNSILARIEAERNGCYDSLLLDGKKRICETSSANIFWFIGDKLYTPKAGMLEGTTRSAVLRISPFEVVQGNYDIDDLQKAEEVFITSAARKILPVAELLPLGLKWRKSANTRIIAGLLDNDIKNYASARKA